MKSLQEMLKESFKKSYMNDFSIAAVKSQQKALFQIIFALYIVIEKEI